MKFLKRCLPVLSLAGLLFLALPGTAHADVNDFTITDFHAAETLTRSDPQGELHVVETINVNFTDNNHGITRAIPEKYKGHNLKFHLNAVTSTSGAPTQVSTSQQNGNLVLRIGDPDRTVTGPQEYTIDYSLQNVITFYKDHDELYWDVNGDQWDQPAFSVDATLTLPSGAKLSGNQPVCYAGGYGSRDGGCDIQVDYGQVHASAASLQANQTLTYVVGFQKGFFTPPTFWDNLRDHAVLLLELIVPPLVGLVVGWTWWFKRGRDARGRGTIVPEYTPPEGLSPLEAGTVADFRVDSRDITATIIDLARRGYIKITETKKNRLLGKDKLSYTLTLTQADFSSLNGYERKLINALFDEITVGTVAKVSDLQHKLAATSTSLRKSVEQDLTTKGYFKQNPLHFAVSGTTFFVIVWIGLILLGHLGDSGSRVLWPAVVGLVIGAILFFIFVHFLPARTALGVAAREHLLGLKMYMDVAEKDRLEKLEGPDAAYAAKSGEPERTVELFEKLLPYAIVLGVEKQWGKQFEHIYTTPPGWYSGNWTSFSAGYLVGSLSSGFTPAMNNTFSAPHSSSGSGFSGGGGFAGGGGGGGGGGGW